jgi:asparagine synthase (glutamine-hydrolysing)
MLGLYDPEIVLDGMERLLSAMQRVMMHQAWYRRQTYLQWPLAVGQVDLGILNPQPQPATNEDKTILVWLDGEIYDYQRRALVQQLQATGHHFESESGAELLAHLYEEMGEDCVRDLDGTFAVAIYDVRLAKMVIAVDRDATRPLYFYTHHNRFLFASEIKAILQDQRVPRQLDEQGLVEFFTFRHVLGERTLFRDVRFLPAGCLATFCDGQARVRPYWLPGVFEDRLPRTQADYLDEAAARVRLALERQMGDGRSMGLLLSGGLDSRLLAGLVPDRLKDQFHTFSRGPLDCWDVKFGTQVAERVGSQHHILELKPDFLLSFAKQGVWLTDGLMTVIDIYELSTIALIKPYVDFVFLGIGSGCGILGGIALSKPLLQTHSVDEAAHQFFAQEGTYIPQAMQARLFSERLYRETRGAAFEALREMLRTYQADTPAGLVEAFCLQCRWPRSAFYGPTLSRTQVETCYPYNDNDLSDFMTRAPARWRFNRQMQIALIKRTRPDLARVPWEYTGVPMDISTPRRIFLQRGFYYTRRQLSGWTHGLITTGTERERANYPVWFRAALRDWLEDTLLDKRALDRGYFNEAFLRHMIAEHMSGRRNYAIQFGLLLTFELWNRLFIEDEPV